MQTRKEVNANVYRVLYNPLAYCDPCGTAQNQQITITPFIGRFLFACMAMIPHALFLVMLIWRDIRPIQPIQTRAHVITHSSSSSRVIWACIVSGSVIRYQYGDRQNGVKTVPCVVARFKALLRRFIFTLAMMKG